MTNIQPVSNDDLAFTRRVHDIVEPAHTMVAIQRLIIARLHGVLHVLERGGDGQHPAIQHLLTALPADERAFFRRRITRLSDALVERDVYELAHGALSVDIDSPRPGPTCSAPAPYGSVAAGRDGRETLAERRVRLAAERAAREMEAMEDDALLDEIARGLDDDTEHSDA